MRGYAVAAAAAFAWLAVGPALGITPWWTLLALGGAWWSLRTYRGLREHYGQPYALMPAMQDNIVAHLATGLLLVAGYLLATAF